MSADKELIKKVDDFREFCVNMATGKSFSYEDYEVARAAIVSEEFLNGLLPNWLIRSRYGSQFWSHMQKQSGTYKGRRDYLNEEFTNLLDRLETDATKPVSISMSDIFDGDDTEEIERIWIKVQQRKANDPDGAITASRSLVETTLKYILESNNVTYTSKDELYDLYKKVAKILSLSPSGHNEQLFKQILGGTTSIVQGFASLRNNYGDAHGKGKVHYVAEERHVELTINLAGTVCSFLIKTNAEHLKKTKY